MIIRIIGVIFVYERKKELSDRHSYLLLEGLTPEYALYTRVSSSPFKHPESCSRLEHP